MDYLRILTRKDKFLKVLDDELRLADENRERETNAAITIQRAFRGSICRAAISKKHFAAGEIERCFRGRLGRKKAQLSLAQKQEFRVMTFFHFMVIQCQRCFRGYYSRKYKQDHAQRKKYCRMIEEKGRIVLEGMERYFLEQAEKLQDDARQKRDEEFTSLAKNLHHLMSTQHVRGVYNPVMHYVGQPTMNALPVEEHIRGVVKDLLRTRGYTKRGLTPDINGAMKIPLKGLKYRLSLQASAPYDTVKEEEKRMKLTHQILTRDKNGGKFLAGGTTRIIDNKDAPLAVGDPYMDPWANPMMVKGVPTSQLELNESAKSRKALFATAVEKPFVSRVGGNRSTALPNDIFDVIGEAEETGGAVHRHLGTKTLRFGLPASADARYEQEESSSSTTAIGGAAGGATGSAADQANMYKGTANVIPKAPYRTSATLRSTTKRIRNYSGQQLPSSPSNKAVNFQQLLASDEQSETSQGRMVDSSDEDD